ncbi:hypothetical protein [Spirosoma soli]
MKTVNSIVFALIMAFVLSSCATKMPFTTSTIAPAATGAVKVKKDKNENFSISVDVFNLAAAKDLTPSRNAYVVWMEAGREPTKNLGQISPSTGLFSKTLKASLNTTSITKPDRVFITAEDRVDIRYPNGEVVLTTR